MGFEVGHQKIRLKQVQLFNSLVEAQRNLRGFNPQIMPINSAKRQYALGQLESEIRDLAEKLWGPRGEEAPCGSEKVPV